MKNNEKDHEEIYQDFKKLVNMSASQLEKWLETDMSKEVGQKEGDGESTGRKSAKKIVKILQTKKDDLNSSDYTHMSKVIAYISRHTAQRPKGDVSNTPWLYSLKNWGYNPEKK
ncbi:MAG: DUF3140 domain-containing protein [Mucilaginibacter polytrichastri]|nr:DUF3140 domain-containing protein [Mucilaginibacter polytrichastri]